MILTLTSDSGKVISSWNENAMDVETDHEGDDIVSVVLPEGVGDNLRAKRKALVDAEVLDTLKVAEAYLADRLCSDVASDHRTDVALARVRGAIDKLRGGSL